MRWKLGEYQLRFNPKSLNKSWNATRSIEVNANGERSNANLTFEGKQDFTIDIYEKPTKVENTPKMYVANNSYVSITEKRYFEEHFILRDTGVVEVIDGSNLLKRSFSVTSSTVTLPSVKPISLAHCDNEIAFLYREATQIAIIITDENGLANRKYTYSSTSTGDLSQASSICWGYGNLLYLLSPHGEVYSVDKQNGSYVELFQTEDFSINKMSGIQAYSSIIFYQKYYDSYIGIMNSLSEITFFDSSNNVVCKAEIGLYNIKDIVTNNGNGKFYLLNNNGVYRFQVNTCRIDIDVIKKVVANGHVEISDENGIPAILNVSNLAIARNKNGNEARYEIDISGDIAYGHKSFFDGWFSINKM